MLSKRVSQSFTKKCAVCVGEYVCCVYMCCVYIYVCVCVPYSFLGSVIHVTFKPGLCTKELDMLMYNLFCRRHNYYKVNVTEGYSKCVMIYM